MQQPEIWERIFEKLKEKVPGHSFRMWFDPMTAELSNDRLTLFCPNQFSKARVEGNYLDLIKETLLECRNGDGPMEIKLSVTQTEKEPEKDETIKPAAIKHVQPSLPQFAAITAARPVLRDDFTLSQLVVGQFNKFAHDVAFNVLQTNNNLQPVFLCSPTGLGKSHIEQALAHHALSLNASTRILYIPASDFMNEFVLASKGGDLEAFKKKFRQNCDVLIIDDVHYLQNKMGTQTELYLTIDHLLNNGKKLFFASMLLPTKIPRMDAQLVSRLSSSIVSEIEPPQFKDRLRILRNVAKTNNLNAPGEVLEFLAAELTEDIRQLKSGLFGFAARTSFAGALPNLVNAQKVVATLAQDRKLVTPKLIKIIVAECFGVKPSDLLLKSRARRILVPRQIAMYLCHQKCTDMTLTAIGRSFNRYHATALHSLRCVEEKIRNKDHAFLAKMEIIEKKLNEAL